MPQLTDHIPPAPPFEPLVLGALSRKGFDLARRSSTGFASWRSHREFEAERDALYIGYGASGVAVEFQRVPFGAFERWARLTGAPLTLDGLDDFAAHLRFGSRYPGARIVGRFGVPGDPAFHRVSTTEEQCVYVRPEIYVRWRDAIAKLGLWEPANLDVYATLVVEFCSRPNGRSLWPAVNSD